GDEARQSPEYATAHPATASASMYPRFHAQTMLQVQKNLHQHESTTPKHLPMPAHPTSPHLPNQTKAHRPALATHQVRLSFPQNPSLLPEIWKQTHNDIRTPAL